MAGKYTVLRQMRNNKETVVTIEEPLKRQFYDK